ncbi:MAG: hypothetical protein WKF84_16400 [Pyrinomonadaceae bacterium]
MAVKTKSDRAAKATTTRRRSGKSDKQRAAATKAEQSKNERDAAQFTEGAIARGEAAARDESGELPPGTTHEIINERADEAPKIVRRRFSMA